MIFGYFGSYCAKINNIGLKVVQMGLSRQLFDKTKAGSAAHKALAWVTFGTYALGAVVAIVLALLLVGGVVILPCVFLVAQTYEDPSMMVLFVDFCVAVVLFAILSNERFRFSALAFFRQLRHRI